MTQIWKPIRQENPAARDRAAHRAAHSADVTPLTPEEAKARGRRNVAIALGLLAFVALIFLVTVFQMKGAVIERSF